MATTVITFASGTDDKPKRLAVDGPGETVANALSSRRGLVKLQRAGGPGPVWVNPISVLYVSETDDRSEPPVAPERSAG
jgi:hypothetical protein